MNQYELIRTAHRIYGKSISEIRRETGHSRNTIAKALKGESWTYKKRSVQHFPSLGPYLKTIDNWLEKDKLSPKKQRHTARRVYNRLVDKYQYKGAESTVRRYVSISKKKLNINNVKVFIPCNPEIGLEAEVDWGTAKVIIEGVETKVKFFCMRSKYSGKHFVKFYPCERQQIFLDAHISAFNFFGGVFSIIIYDNLTTAVNKILRGKKRVEQEAFAKFRAYYNFKACFTNPASGHEKGGVEGTIAFVRKNYMVPIPKAKRVDELNINIQNQCLKYGRHKIDGRNSTVSERFENEKTVLVKLPKIVFSNIQIYESKVDKYATVRIDRNRYSVPTNYAGCKVTTLLGANNLNIFNMRKKIATHKRNYKIKEWCIISDHYLDLIKKRPFSFSSARAIQQWKRLWPRVLDKMLEKMRLKYGKNSGTKDFVSLLMLYRKYKSSEIEAAVELALESGVFNSDGVEHILLFTKEKTVKNKPLPNWKTFMTPDASVYAQLGSVK